MFQSLRKDQHMVQNIYSITLQWHIKLAGWFYCAVYPVQEKRVYFCANSTPAVNCEKITHKFSKFKSCSYLCCLCLRICPRLAKGREYHINTAPYLKGNKLLLSSRNILIVAKGRNCFLDFRLLRV